MKRIENIIIARTKRNHIKEIILEEIEEGNAFCNECGGSGFYKDYEIYFGKETCELCLGTGKIFAGNIIDKSRRSF